MAPREIDNRASADDGSAEALRLQDEDEDALVFGQHADDDEGRGLLKITTVDGLESATADLERGAAAALGGTTGDEADDDNDEPNSNGRGMLRLALLKQEVAPLARLAWPVVVAFLFQTSLNLVRCRAATSTRFLGTARPNQLAGARAASL